MLHIYESHLRSLLWGESPGDLGTKLGARDGIPDTAPSPRGLAAFDVVNALGSCYQTLGPK